MASSRNPASAICAPAMTWSIDATFGGRSSIARREGGAASSRGPLSQRYELTTRADRGFSGSVLEICSTYFQWWRSPEEFEKRPSSVSTTGSSGRSSAAR